MQSILFNSNQNKTKTAYNKHHSRLYSVLSKDFNFSAGEAKRNH